MNTSEVLNESRNVLYGDEHQNEVTLHQVYELLTGINGRLTQIEKDVAPITQLNAVIEKLLKDFNDLKVKVKAVDTKTSNLQERFNKAEMSINQIKNDNEIIERELKDIKKKSTVTENDLQGISNFMDDFKSNHEANVKEVKAMKSTVSKVANNLEDQAAELRQEMKNTISDVREEAEELRDEILDLKCRSMKNNLVFTGIQENEQEDTEDILRNFIKKTLRVSIWIEFGNVHRFGHGAKPGRRGKPRPIVARFIYHKDLAMVLSNTYRLKGKPYGVNQQFPEVIEQARRSLYPIMKQKREEGHRVQLVRDVLYVDGEVYQEHLSDGESSAMEGIATGRETPSGRPDRKRRRVSTPRNGR